MNDFSRRDLLRAGLIGAGVVVAGRSGICSTSAARRYTAPVSFHHDHIFGTSLDLLFHAADKASCAYAEDVVLGELDRLKSIFSLFDPNSELSRLNRTTGQVAASRDLLHALRIYETWQLRTAGANHAQIAEFARLWSMAEREQRVPTAAELRQVRNQMTTPGWTMDAEAGVVARTGLPLNLNCVVKGYALDSAKRLVQSKFPEITAGLINLGGDLAAWGNESSEGWLVAVQSPHRHADNELPHTVVRLRDFSAATSGSYLRGYAIGNKSYSHIIDPRTGLPADRILGATVIAPDSTTANVLATTLCVLEPATGLALLAQHASAAAIVFPSSGETVRSANFSTYEQLALAAEPANETVAETPAPEPAGEAPIAKPDASTPAAGEAWPADFEVSIALELPSPGGRARRPYVAVWIEDANEKPIRSLTVWGNNPRWLPELSGWWKIGRDDKELIRATTRATRAPGKYELVWDGKDDGGKPLPQGTYTVRIEAHREHGQHRYQHGKLECGAAEAEITLEKNSELEATTIAYGKKK